MQPLPGCGCGEKTARTVWTLTVCTCREKPQTKPLIPSCSISDAHTVNRELRQVELLQINLPMPGELQLIETSLKAEPLHEGPAWLDFYCSLSRQSLGVATRWACTCTSRIYSGSTRSSFCLQILWICFCFSFWSCPGFFSCKKPPWSYRGIVTLGFVGFSFQKPLQAR